jgi:hypothetical protein
MVINILEVTVADIITTCSPEYVGSRFLLHTGYYLNNYLTPQRPAGLTTDPLLLIRPFRV